MKFSAKKIEGKTAIRCLDSSAAGHVEAGEDYDAAARREVRRSSELTSR